jgi:hypothetical protein
MARRSHTYAIRLVIEGGGQVKAELVSVGQSGEQSLTRIESAGERASGGLKGLGGQRPITVVVNVTAADASSFRASQGQIAADMARAIDRASRNR